VRLAGIYNETSVVSVNGLPEGGVAATVQLAMPQARKYAEPNAHNKYQAF